MVEITRTVEAESGLRRTEIHIPGRPGRRALLTIEMQGSDTSSIVVEAPERPYSSSPSKTYPIRVALIRILAPTAVYVNDFLGNAVGQVIQSMLTAIFILLGAFVWGFGIMAVIFSIWRCVGGPSFEAVLERTQARLDRLSRNESLQYLRIDVLQVTLDRVCRNERFRSVVDICRHGWHPEKQAAGAAEVDADVEKEAAPKAETG